MPKAPLKKWLTYAWLIVKFCFPETSFAGTETSLPHIIITTFYLHYA